MKVKELIEKLQECDPEAVVVVQSVYAPRGDQEDVEATMLERGRWKCPTDFLDESSSLDLGEGSFSAVRISEEIP